MLISGNTLLGHIARANRQWRGWESNPNVKVIFHGPHCYISPTYYRPNSQVPTWNYTAASVTGRIQIIHSLDEQRALMRSLVNEFESAHDEPWTLDDSNERVMALFSAVVFFKIEIENIEAKFKLNQNKSREDRESVIQQLLTIASPFNQEIGRLMHSQLLDLNDPAQ